MISKIRSCWNRFFFSDVDCRVYGFLRICLGTILLIYACILGPDWLRWFADDGVMSKAAARASIDSDAWTVLQWLPATHGVLWAVFAIICIQIVLFLAGIFTRFQTVCLFIWVTSLQHRNDLIWEGEDILLRVALFLAIFMPLGAIWSVDSLRKSKVRKSYAQIWPLRLLQLQQAVLYFSSVGQKLYGNDWWSGYALYYASRLDDFSGRMLTLRLSADYLWLYQTLTWLTLAIEILLVWAIWMPSLRKQTVMVGVLFHLGLELSMNLFMFQWLMIFILITHLFRVREQETTSRI